MSHNGEPNLFDSVSAFSSGRKQRVDPNGYKIVSVRLREAEFEAFSEQAGALGLTNNMALRIAARKIAGFLEIDDEMRELLLDVSSGIDQISERILDLRAACVSNGQVDMKEFAEQHAAFGRQFFQLNTQLSTVLNVSQRRIDGRIRLQKAMGS